MAVSYTKPIISEAPVLGEKRNRCDAEASRKFIEIQNELCRKEGEKPNCILTSENQTAANEQYVSIKNKCNKLLE